MSDAEEEILGDVFVAARLGIGTERLRLFFTDRRILVAHIGKRGVASPGLGTFFGSLSSAVEDVVKGGRESVGKRRLKSSGPREILASDKDNFSINYTEIVNVSYDRAHLQPRFTLLTSNDKFEFIVQGEPKQLLDLLQKFLPEKMTVT